MKLSSRKLVVLVVVVAFALLPFFVTPTRAAEPSLPQILENLGFTNIIQSSVQTFSAGTYNATLLAEFAGWHEDNELSYYELDDPNVFNVIFTGPEGNSGYTDPQVNKSFIAAYEFGFSLITPESHRYFTENNRNEGGIQHAKVYENLDDPGMYMIGFENQYGWEGDRDFNDIVFSIKSYETTVEYYLTVKTDPASIVTIPGEGWYNNCTSVDLTAPDFVPTSGFRYRFDYWDVDGTPQGSNAITVHIDDNHTATAHYVTQYYLTVISLYDNPEGEGWYDNYTYANATLLSDIVDHGNGTRRVFVNWAGDASGTNYAKSNPVYMDQNKTAIANWKTQYYLTMSTNFGTVNPSNGWHDVGSIVSIGATPPSTISGERYVWNGWTGTGTGSYTGLNNPNTITMNGPITQTASWTHQYYLTVTSPYDTPGCEDWYDSGSTVYAILNTGTMDHGNGTRRIFISWGGDAAGTNYAQSDPIIMDGPKTAIANWKTQYYLTITSSSGGVSDPSSSGWNDSGTIVSITAISDTYYLFDHWELDSIDVGSNNPYNLTMNTMHTLNAVFVQEMATLTITVSSGGTTDQPPGFYVYPAGTSVTVTAIPDENYVLDYWELDGGDVGSANPFIVFLNPDHTLHAVFVYIPPSTPTYYLTAKTDPPGVTAISGEGWYNESENVILTAPEYVDVSTGVRYRFTYWDIDGTPQGIGVNPINVYMDTNHTATAHYISQYYLTVSSSYGSPTPSSGWFDEGTSITASVTSPESGPTSTRYVCTGWIGTGSVPTSGTTTSVTFTINTPSSVTWNWKTQYYLTVKTNPLGITMIPGEGWYDESIMMPLTAPSVTGYTFLYWDVNSASQGTGVKSISVIMDEPQIATTYYEQKLVIVGGSTLSIKSPLLHIWISLNALLVAVIFMAASWIRRRQGKN